MAVWSQVRFSTLPADKRFDAEYYQPEYLHQADTITRGPHKRIADIAQVSDGNHMAISEKFCEEGVRYLRGQDLGDFFISDTDPLYIPQNEYAALSRSHMNENDVLVGIVGTIGSVGLITDRHGQLTGNCKLAILRPKTIEPEFLAAYLFSRVGQNEIRRRIRGTVQMGLILPDLKSIPVPILPQERRRKIASLVREAYNQRTNSLSLYTQAESVLLKELGLDKLDASPVLCYERRFSEVRQAGRLDAEYFQPRFQKAFHLLGNQKCTIGDVAKLLKRRFVPKRGVSFQYIEIGDVADCGSIESQEVAGENAPSRATWIVRPGDVITSTVRPIRRLSALIEPSQSGYVCSSGFAVLTPQTVPSELLLVYLRLPLIAEILDLHCSASMYPSISTNDLLRIPFRKPSDATMDAIKTMVDQSRAARTESRRLLDEAKEMVEKAVLEN